MRDVPGHHAGPTGSGIDRRRFLAAGAAALAAAVAPGGIARACGSPVRAADVGGGREQLDRVGLQLYTIRTEMARDFARSLERVARIGYEEVEFAGYFDHPPREVRTILKANGLRAPAAHVPLDRLRSDLKTVLQEADIVGHEYIVCPSPGSEPHTPEGFGRVIDALNRAGAAARRAGIGIAYHNHDAEFVPFPDGRRPYDYLLAHLDPHLVRLELDIFWAFKGGADPLDLFKRAPGRFPMVHVKDMDSAGTMRDVGKGTIDFARIFLEHRRAGIRHYFVEHDEPEDPWRSVTDSYHYLRDLTFAEAA